MPSTPKTSVHLLIQGRVQGVGFRFFTQARAEELGISGWVRNAPGEEVEAWGQGPAADLESWINKLRQGPTMARVDSIAIDWQSPLENSSGFEIR